MWTLKNETPFAAERSWVRDRDGGEVWIVAAKATFSIHDDGSLRLATDQEPVCLAPRYIGDPASSTLAQDSDVYLSKPATDVTLHGHAYAPGGVQATQVDVTLVVGERRKTLRVYGDRVWEKGLAGPRLPPPDPFVRVKLCYENAYGGVDTRADSHAAWDVRNPIGTGYATAAAHIVGRRAPNIEDPHALISTWSSRPAPRGFAPIPVTWSPRRGFAGTYDERWRQQRSPLLPEDFDDRFHLCAPADQQISGYLHGGEAIELCNLTPSGRLRFHLPKPALRVTTRLGRRDIEQPMILHLVHLDADLSRLITVWHAALPCHRDVLRLSHSTIRLKARLDRVGRRISREEEGWS